MTKVTQDVRPRVSVRRDNAKILMRGNYPRPPVQAYVINKIYLELKTKVYKHAVKNGYTLIYVKLVREIEITIITYQ